MMGTLSLTFLMSACSTQHLTWQQRRLEHPTAAELQWERNNHVMIHEGMKDREVEQALDNLLNHVQSMMIVKNVVTDDKGNPLKDLETGNVVTEEDGYNQITLQRLRSRVGTVKSRAYVVSRSAVC